MWNSPASRREFHLHSQLPSHLNLQEIWLIIIFVLFRQSTCTLHFLLLLQGWRPGSSCLIYPHTLVCVQQAFAKGTAVRGRSYIPGTRWLWKSKGEHRSRSMYPDLSTCRNVESGWGRLAVAHCEAKSWQMIFHFM